MNQENQKVYLGLGGAEHLTDRLALRVRLADRGHAARAGLHAASERRQIPQHLKQLVRHEIRDKSETLQQKNPTESSMTHESI